MVAVSSGLPLALALQAALRLSTRVRSQSMPAIVSSLCWQVNGPPGYWDQKREIYIIAALRNVKKKKLPNRGRSSVNLGLEQLESVRVGVRCRM